MICYYIDFCYIIKNINRASSRGRPIFPKGNIIIIIAVTIDYFIGLYLSYYKKIISISRKKNNEFFKIYYNLKLVGRYFIAWNVNADSSPIDIS